MHSDPWLLVGCPALGGLGSASLLEEVQLHSLGTVVGVCPLLPLPVLLCLVFVAGDVIAQLPVPAATPSYHHRVLALSRPKPK